MTVTQFKAALVCQKKAKLLKLGATEVSEEMSWMSNIQDNHLSQWLNAESVDAAIVLITEQIERIDKEWYSGDAEWAAAKSKFYEQFTRLVAYFKNNGYSIVSGVEKYSYQYITDKIDLTATDANGNVHKIKFDLYHAPVHTAKAKQDKNKPQFSLDLVLPAIALGGDAYYDVWYLRGKDDQGGRYPEFEKRPNCNIISFCYKDYDVKVALQSAIEFSKAECTPDDCKKCRVSDLCKGYAPIPEGSPVSAEDSGSVPVLTEAQEKVASWVNGMLAAIAVPGSGKTSVLIERAVRLILIGIFSGNILFLSHTRKAVEEIINRLAKRLGVSRDDEKMPVVMTLNGFGYNILRDNESLLGHNLKLASDGQRRELLERVLNDPTVQKISGVNYAVMKGDYGLLDRADAWVSYYKENGDEKFSSKFPKVDIFGVKAVSNALDALYEEYGYIRYDQQIRLAAEMLREHPDLAEKYSKIYRYVMVDEYQDCNAEQDEMVRLLCVHNNLVIVGDDDQAIYDWRGGSTDHIIRFAKGNPTVIMADNFRTNKPIANLSNLIISRNQKRIPKQIVAGRDAQNKPALLINPSDKQIVTYIGACGKRYGGGNVAVIARDNRVLKKIEDLLSEYGINHAASKDYLTDSKVFSLLRDVLRVHEDGPDGASEAFARLYASECGLPDLEAGYEETFHQMLIRNGLILDCNDTVANAKAWINSELPSAQFGQKLTKSYKIINYGENASAIIKDLFDIWFSGKENELSVLRVILDMFEESMVMSAENALRDMDVLVKYNDKTRVDYDYGPRFIRLLTAHDAKGKEFDAVVVLNIDDFIKGGTEEDNRVLYVAVTRARHSLILTTSGGEMENEIVSQIESAVQKCQ